jgi:hypothetical protein
MSRDYLIRLRDMLAAATAVPVGAEPSRKGPTDAGGCAGDEREWRAAAQAGPVMMYASCFSEFVFAMCSPLLFAWSVI